MFSIHIMLCGREILMSLDGQIMATRELKRVYFWFARWKNFLQSVGVALRSNLIWCLQLTCGFCTGKFIAVAWVLSLFFIHCSHCCTKTCNSLDIILVKKMSLILMSNNETPFKSYC